MFLSTCISIFHPFPHLYKTAQENATAPMPTAANTEKHVSRGCPWHCTTGYVRRQLKLTAHAPLLLSRCSGKHEQMWGFVCIRARFAWKLNIRTPGPPVHINTWHLCPGQQTLSGILEEQKVSTNHCSPSVASDWWGTREKHMEDVLGDATFPSCQTQDTDFSLRVITPCVG